MPNERIQMPISADQRRRLQAFEEIRAMRGRFRSREELNEIAANERRPLRLETGS